MTQASGLGQCAPHVTSAAATAATQTNIAHGAPCDFHPAAIAAVDANVGHNGAEVNGAAFVTSHCDFHPATLVTADASIGHNGVDVSAGALTGYHCDSIGAQLALDISHDCYCHC